MNTMTESSWSTDLTRLCERLAERLHAEGAEHPVEAAVALTARGHRGVGPDEFCEQIGVEPGALQAVEAGGVAWASFPPALELAIRDTPGIDLPRLGLGS